MRLLPLVAICACLPVLVAKAESGVPPLPDRNPLRTTAPVAAPVKPPPPPPPGEQPTVPWTEAEIDAAKAVCKELLSGDPLDYEELPPIKEGICGTPAPVLLRAVGTDQKVVIDPPATMTCPMADVLGEWLRDAVQPEAKKRFGSPVVKIRNASAYVCRNRYGGGTAPLSEHALANAFDVSEFVLANGERISVLNDWPKVVEVPPPPLPNPEREPKAEGKDAEKETNSEDAKRTGATQAKAPVSSPTPPAPAAKEPDEDPKTKFVTFLHEDACRRFGTVLGPAANAAHKDHFHLDMKKRRKGFCE